jgi:acyl-CoA reductase-like NAD-dependent aldehyde dehydrogenase
VVFENPSETARVYKEEIFGPVAVMKVFSSDEEVVKMANDSEFGLMASVFTADVDRAARMTEVLEAGTVCVNTSMALSHRAPFGGKKQSGYGSEGGLESVLAYTQVKTVIQLVS